MKQAQPARDEISARVRALISELNGALPAWVPRRAPPGARRDALIG